MRHTFLVPLLTFTGSVPPECNIEASFTEESSGLEMLMLSCDFELPYPKRFKRTVLLDGRTWLPFSLV